jgi:hypothetical protein
MYDKVTGSVFDALAENLVPFYINEFSSFRGAAGAARLLLGHLRMSWLSVSGTRLQLADAEDVVHNCQVAPFKVRSLRATAKVVLSEMYWTFSVRAKQVMI